MCSIWWNQMPFIIQNNDFNGFEWQNKISFVKDTRIYNQKKKRNTSHRQRNKINLSTDFTTISYFFLFIKARKTKWKEGICIRVYAFLFEPFKAFFAATAAYTAATSVVVVVVGRCIKDSVDTLFFHHQFYYFLQIYFSFHLLFSNFTCC